MGPSSRFRLCSCMCVYTWYENRGQRSSLVSFFKHCLHFPWFLLLAWGGPQRDKADCQSIPQILLSPPPKYWNYYQVTMYSVVGSWGLSSGPDSCQASTLMAEISPHSQVQMILLNKKFKNDSLVCFLSFFFFVPRTSLWRNDGHAPSKDISHHALQQRRSMVFMWK